MTARRLVASFVVMTSLVLPGRVFAQTAQFFQTLGLAHLELKPQLEKLIAHLCFLMPKFFVGQVSNFIRFHELSVETLLATSLQNV